MIDRHSEQWDKNYNRAWRNTLCQVCENLLSRRYLTNSVLRASALRHVRETGPRGRSVYSQNEESHMNTRQLHSHTDYQICPFIYDMSILHAKLVNH